MNFGLYALKKKTGTYARVRVFIALFTIYKDLSYHIMCGVRLNGMA